MIKNFLLKSVLLTLILIAICYLLLWKYTNGYVDDFYVKYTHSKSNALIIGSSRALQGLNPDSVFKNTEYSSNALNFAFTSANSPYSDVYLNAIKKVVDINSNKGIFVLEVNPMALCAKKDSMSGEIEHREEKLPLAFQLFFNQSPNVEYIFKHYEKPLYKLFIQNNADDSFKISHQNGWLEVKIKFDTIAFRKRRDKNYKTYLKSYPNYSFDSLRYKKLNETIVWLSNFGKVYLVRLPVDSKVLELENRNVTNFNELMQQIAANHKTEYIHFTQPEGSVYTIDGGHMHRYATSEVSKALNKAIFEKTIIKLKVLTQNDYN
jgi:hypothetical protein